MKTEHIHPWLLLVVALTWLALGVPRAFSAEPSPSAASRLVGTWKLVSIEERDASGKLVEPLDFGSEPAGMLTYDASGHMAAQAMRRGRPRLASEDVHRATPAEAKTAFVGYAAYFGTYEVRGSEGLVIHHVEASLLPNWEGGEQRRKFTLSGDKLILEPPPFKANGDKRSRRLMWQRVQ